MGRKDVGDGGAPPLEFHGVTVLCKENECPHYEKSSTEMFYIYDAIFSTLSNSRGLVVIVVTEIEIHGAKLCPVSTRELNGG